MGVKRDPSTPTPRAHTHNTTSHSLLLQLQENENKRRMAEEAKKNLDKSLIRDGLKFSDLARDAAKQDEQRKKEQADLAKQRTTHSQHQAYLERKRKLDAALKMKADFAKFLKR